MFSVRRKSTRKDREAVKQFLHELGLDTPSVHQGVDYDRAALEAAFDLQHQTRLEVQNELQAQKDSQLAGDMAFFANDPEAQSKVTECANGFLTVTKEFIERAKHWNAAIEAYLKLYKRNHPVKYWMLTTWESARRLLHIA